MVQQINTNNQRDFNIVYLAEMNPTSQKKLGEGGFSSVYLVTHNKVTYACKKINLSHINFKVRYLIDEINSMRCLDHPNLVRVHGFALNSFNTFDLYTQYIQGKTMDIAYGPIPQEELLFYWVYQIAKAFVYLQEVGIVHRDIKPQNILINTRGLVKIIDFGIAKMLIDNHSKVTGSPPYIAPEIIKENFMCHKSDIWSLGISLYQLTHKKLPFQYKSDKEIFAKICNEKIAVSRQQCSEQLAVLIQRMLQVQPENRISAQQILDLDCLKSREQMLRGYYERALKKK